MTGDNRTGILVGISLFSDQIDQKCTTIGTGTARQKSAAFRIILHFFGNTGFSEVTCNESAILEVNSGHHAHFFAERILLFLDYSIIRFRQNIELIAFFIQFGTNGRHLFIGIFFLI